MSQVVTLYSDKEKTDALYPRTKVSAISDDNNTPLKELMTGTVKQEEGGTEEEVVTPVNADTLGGKLTANNVVFYEEEIVDEVGQVVVRNADKLENHPASYFATSEELATKANSEDLNTKANKSDVLSLEEIQASTDLAGKIASASALKNLKSSLGVLDVTSFNVNTESSIDISVDYKSCYLLIGVHRFAGTWCRALNTLQDRQVAINTWNFGNLGESLFNVVSKDDRTCTLAVGGVGNHVSCFLIRLGKAI